MMSKSILLLAVILYSGCAMGPHEERQIYQNVLPQASPMREEENRSNLDEYRLKGDLIKAKPSWTLLDCFTLAMLESRLLKIAGEDYFRSVADKRLSIASVLPKVRARSSYFRQDGAAEFGSLQERRDHRLVFEQPIFTGFQELGALKRSNQNILSKEAQLRFEKARIFSLVGEAFYDVLKWQASLKTLNLMMEIQNERLRQVKERFQIGLVRKTEVLTVQIDLADIEADARVAEGQLQISRIQLAVVIGYPVERPLKDQLITESRYEAIHGGDSVELQKIGELNALIQEALRKREDLIALRYLARGIKAEIGIAKGKFLPVVTFLGNYYLHREGPQENIDWDISLIAELPLFEGGANLVEVQKAKSRYRQALLVFEDEERVVEQEVSSAYYIYQSMRDQTRVNKKRVKLAEENYELIQEEYRQGLASHLDVQLRYHDLVDAKLSYTNVKWDLKSAYVKLLFTIGKLTYSSTD